MPHFSVAFSGLLLSLALASTAQAQTATPADTARTYKHHLGLTASPVLDQFFTANRSLPVGLLYKRQTAPNKLWRFGLVVNQDYGRRDENNMAPSPAVNVNDEYVRNNWGVGSSVGHEYTHRFSQRWVGTVGADIGLGFSQYTNQFSTQFPGNQTIGTPPIEIQQYSRYRYYQAAFAPFAGLRYALWPSLYISAESSVSLDYALRIQDGKMKTTNLSSNEVTSGNTLTELFDQSFKVRFRLLNQLSLHYMLKSK